MFVGMTGDHGDGDLHDASVHHDQIDFHGGHDASGIDHHGDISLDHSGDFHDGHGDIADAHSTDMADGHDSDHHDSDASFKFVSLQGLTAFFMMFGWVGLAITRDSGLSGFAAVLGGIIAGIFTVYLLGTMFKFAMKLQSDGTMRIRTALGSGGSVYLRIPGSGSTGQVQVEVDGRLKVFDAISATKEEIKTGEQITVVWVQDNGVLVVEKDERGEGGKLCGR
jgi:membrane protein implicated in regulation of membrane protease activity